MCGLFGYAGWPRGSDPTVLRDAAVLAATRGPHAWGVAWARGPGLERVTGGGHLDGTAWRLAEAAGVGDAALVIGHARLATSGGPGAETRAGDRQPILVGSVAVAHNGNVYNWRELARDGGIRLRTGCDSEVLAHLIERGCGPLLARVSVAVALVDPDSPLALLAVDAGAGAIVAGVRGHPLHALRRPEGAYFCSRALPGSAPLSEGVHAWTEAAWLTAATA